MFCCVLSFTYNIFYALIAISFTSLLLLIVSEEYRKWFFAIIFSSKLVTKWSKDMSRKLKPIWLKEFIELKTQNPNEKINVLEVGVGIGANFEFYPDNCRLIVLDYNDNFKNDFMKNIKKYSKIEFESYLTGSVEDMNQLKDNTFDVVLITHVFCSVPDVTKGLKEVKRVLKPGGKFFFIEHVAFQQESFYNKLVTMVQIILNPLWKVMFGGCELNRKTWIQIENTNFTSLKLDHGYPKIVNAILRPHIYGWAMK